MKDIQMVDLKSQYHKIKEEIDSKVLEVIESSAFINGYAVKDFQANLEKYLDVRNVIPCGNGTDALQVAMMALGLKPGDEVITAPFTFIATAEVVALLGLKPVFVDVEEGTFNIDVKQIEAAITPNTKAIVPVHLFGQCCDMEPILAIAKKHNIFVIEDACQAIGAEYTFTDGTVKKAGTMGTVGCTSFFPSKNLGCYGDGGALFTQDDELAHTIRGIVNHGMFTRYYHDMIGVNSRLDSIQAAILDIKLKHLDEYNEARRKAADYYDKAFSGLENVTIPERAKYSRHIFHQYTLKIKNVDRQRVIDEMKKIGVPVMIYYPVPLHLQKAFANAGGKVGDFPVTEKLCNEVISLPMHTELDEEQQRFIVENIVKYL